jgi:hypothetical protein
MILIALVIALAPLAWAAVCITRWRSGSYRSLLLGGVAVGFAGVVFLVTGPVLQSVFWLSPIMDTTGAILILLGWFCMLEGVFMTVAGVVIRLTFGRRTDSQS